MDAGRVSAARQRAIEEFATWDVLFLGGGKQTGAAAWDVKDAVGVDHVAWKAGQTPAYTCGCQSFATGGGQPCIHIELVREALARTAASGGPGPTRGAVRETSPAASAPPPPAPVAPVVTTPPAPPPAPVVASGPAAARGDTLLAAAGIIGELAGIRAALEGILARMTPKEERDRITLVDSYVRSANRGGDLVWLYAAHPGLKYRVAVVYTEDFPALVEFLDPSVGKVFDGEVAPSKLVAAERGYLITCRTPFEVVQAPTEKRTDKGQVIYEFRAARAVGH